MQVCTSLQTDNHASTLPLNFLQARCPSRRPTNSVNAREGRNHPHSLKYVPVQLPLTITLAITCRFASRAPLLQQSTDISHPPGSQQQTCSSEKMTASYKSLTGPNTLGPSDLQSWRGRVGPTGPIGRSRLYMASAQSNRTVNFSTI